MVKFYEEFMTHKRAVQLNIELSLMFIDDKELMEEMAVRATSHDNSKVEDKVEFENYIGLNMDMVGVQYGTPQYKEVISKYSEGVEHHYANNPHHPEYYENGIDDMSRADLIEMVADWSAVVKVKGLEDKMEDNFQVNKKRFRIDDELFERIMNTAKFMIIHRHPLTQPNLLQNFER